MIGTSPAGETGLTATPSRTPATPAGIAVISTVDGYAARPPGTYRPARSTGRTASETVTPSASYAVGGTTAWASWYARMRVAASSSALRTSTGVAATASSHSATDTRR